MLCAGCKEDKPIKAKGLCNKCYTRFQRHGDVSWERKKKGNKLCSYCQERPVHAKDLCASCYSRYLKNNSPAIVRVKIKKECSFCGKFGYIKARGLCNKCYARLLRTGSVEYSKVKRIAICGFCGEEKEIKAQGLCSSCYCRARRNGTPEYVKVKKICRIDGCNNFRVSNGLCDMHRQRVVKHGHTKQTRPKGWGSKEKHPLYQTWCWLKRKEPNPSLCVEWQDFWQFAEDAGERPSPKHRFHVIDKSKPIYKDNYEWQVWQDGGSSREKRTAYCRQWRKDNPEKIKNSELKKVFGIDLDEYHSMLKKQDYHCAICGNGEAAINPRTKKALDLAVDHCHETGKIRGLLCKNCNNMIGYAKDSPELLIKALNYLLTSTI